MRTKMGKIQEFQTTSLTAFLLGPDSSCGLALRYNGEKVPLAPITPIQSGHPVLWRRLSQKTEIVSQHE